MDSKKFIILIRPLQVDCLVDIVLEFGMHCLVKYKKVEDLEEFKKQIKTFSFNDNLVN